MTSERRKEGIKETFDRLVRARLVGRNRQKAIGQQEEKEIDHGMDLSQGVFRLATSRYAADAAYWSWYGERHPRPLRCVRLVELN